MTATPHPDEPTTLLDMRFSCCSAITAGALVLASTAPTQAFSTTFTANQPLEVSFNGVASHPAGPLTSDGALTRTFTLGQLFTARLAWTVPTATDLSCSVTASFDTGSLGGSLLPAQYQSDSTLWISGPAGRWGTVAIEIVNNRGSWPTVDIFDDGSNDAVLGNQYGSVGSGALRREWSIPVQLTQNALPVRIAHNLNTEFSDLYQYVRVRFVPWATPATDLGSSCADNHTGWVIGENEDQDYGLTVRLGTGSAAAELHATGYGLMQLFVLGASPNRRPVGSLQLGHGCDDLLTNIITVAPGTAPYPIHRDEWTLSIPQLPPGVIVYLQHVSLGNVGPTTYFGATNVVRYQT